MPAIAGKLQLASGKQIETFTASASSSDIIMWTPGANGMEKADPACVENSSDMIAALFKLFKGKLPANALFTEACQTIDRTFDPKLHRALPRLIEGCVSPL